MAWLPDYLEPAVRKVAHVSELIKTHQPLLLLHLQGQTAQPLAQSLLGEALRALHLALSAMTVMQQQQQQRLQIGSSSSSSSSSAAASLVLVVKPEPPPQLSSSPSPASELPADSKGSVRSGKRRRPAANEGGGKTKSWAILTTVPHEDGYEWRKYGEKSINGTHFTRSYFRCTYKGDKGCLATKYVQQQNDSSDTPMFKVTYNNNHTCNCTAGSPSSAKNNINNIPVAGGAAASNYPPTGGHHDFMVTEQEITAVVPPPLADGSAGVRLDEQMPCAHQERLAITDRYDVTVGAVGESSRLPGVSSNELDRQIVTEPMMGDYDQELQDDLELLFLHDNFCYRSTTG